MHLKVLDKTSTLLLYLEQKFGIHFSSLLVAFILLCIAAIYVTPSIAPLELGRGYASLSTAPFDFSEQNNLRFRILTPLIAYCLGLRGSLYIIFPLIVALLFLSCIYFYMRKTQAPAESLLITMLVCFSSPILFLLHFQGYVDVTSYLLILLMIIFIKKTAVWIPLMALLLLNHESNLFIIPGLLYFYYIHTPNKTKAILNSFIGLVLAYIPFYFYRRYINEVSPVEYNFEMYYSQIKENIKSIAIYFPIGFFYAFKLFWLFPMFAIYYYWKEKNQQQLLFYTILIVGVISQLLFASDTSRLIGLAFPVILFSALKIKQEWGTELFLKRTFYLILINFLIPQYYVGQSVMIRFYPLPSSLILKCFGGIET
ncbi:MAG: hypothetical protein V4547_07205 [Bacteroidota bacterium]